jgi:ABC-2 type transport system ATP-binding protein/lipopolysaccharide transport system ATP-binding protein
MQVASIILKDVSVDIPIYDVHSKSLLRKMVLNRAVGGRFAQAGSHVTVIALKNISFEAQHGDRIALVGNNGSGKSTLLRVLSEVYPPTRGSVQVDGRISPLFDATLGMSMDATGWENIRMCGRLWGLTRSQVEDSIADIVGFTELGEYLSVPVRTYSTGMMLRLAFAIATVRAPDVMLIDEVIGVGDARFFEKAFARLRGVVERSSILFVASHADEILRLLCNKAIWLQNGTLMAYGDINEVIAAYRGAQADDDPQKPAADSDVAAPAATQV